MAIDIVLILVVLILVVNGWFKGALRMAAGLLVGIVSLIAAGLLTGKISGFLTGLLVSDQSKLEVIQRINAGHQNQDSTSQILSQLGILPKLQKNLVMYAQPTAGDQGQFTRKLADGLAEHFIGILAFILLFIFINFCLNLFLNSASSVLNRMPLIGFANRLAGAAIGLVYAYLICLLIVTVISGVSPFVDKVHNLTRDSHLYTLVTSPQLTAWIYDKIFKLGNLFS